MQSNEKKTPILFDCIKIKLYLYCQRRRNGLQGCNRGGLQLIREQMAVREIGLPFFFVLIYKMDAIPPARNKREHLPQWNAWIIAI